MIVVVYDDEEFEPITVVDLPGLTERDIAAQRRWRVALPPPPVAFTPRKMPMDDTELLPVQKHFVEFNFERFVRERLDGEKQVRWACFTKATELALQLIPGFLPGQRPAVAALQRQNERLLDLLCAIAWK